MTTVQTNYTLHIKESADVKNLVIYNQETNEEAFLNVQYLEGSISDDLKVMEHPKEDGTSIADHVIDDAKSGTVRLIISDDDSISLNEILDYYQNRTMLILKIKNNFYTNMIISSKPVKADPQYYDKTVYDLAFKEVLEAQTQYVKMSVPQVQGAKNASTINAGQKQAISTNKVKPSVLRAGLNKLTGDRIKPNKL